MDVRLISKHSQYVQHLFVRPSSLIPPTTHHSQRAITLRWKHFPHETNQPISVRVLCGQTFEWTLQDASSTLSTCRLLFFSFLFIHFFYLIIFSFSFFFSYLVFPCGCPCSLEFGFTSSVLCFHFGVQAKTQNSSFVPYTPLKSTVCWIMSGVPYSYLLLTRE